jgi:hypothetical protein
LYQSTIKQGDFLLNRIQKLSRVIDIWSHKLLSSASFISFSWFWAADSQAQVSSSPDNSLSIGGWRWSVQ